jgi:hypothetical protein
MERKESSKPTQNKNPHTMGEHAISQAGILKLSGTPDSLSSAAKQNEFCLS